MAGQDVGPILNGIPTQLPDIDPDETREWVESLAGLVHAQGRDRARYVMLRLLESARAMNVGVPSLTTTDYINTIPFEQEPWFPGDEEVERRFRAYLRWNAAVLVHRAQRPGIGVGGHISTYASAATLYEVGFNHFWRGKDHPGGGDQIFFQGHASPGMYARAFLEGRISSDRLDKSVPRRVGTDGLGAHRQRRPGIEYHGVAHRSARPRKHVSNHPGVVHRIPAAQGIQRGLRKSHVLGRHEVLNHLAVGNPPHS